MTAPVDPRPTPDADTLRETVEDLVRQFAYETVVDGVPCLWTGGLSALEGAFAVLGWSDPYPLATPVETFGSRLRAARTRRGMTLRELRAVSGVSIPYLSDLENGRKTRPSVGMAKRLARALGVSLMSLVGEEP